MNEPQVPLTRGIRKQITDAAARMYREAVWGKPTADRPLGLDAYAKDFWRQEDADEWELGYCDSPDRVALVYLFEAIRQMNGTNYTATRTCIRLALEELDGRADRFVGI